MKKGRLLVLAAASAAFCMAAVACGEDEHTHSYGEWTITQEPTLTAEGSATRTCTANDGGTETVSVPSLSNTEVWTAETQSASHTQAGKTVYTSVYGRVEIPIAQGEHEWGNWTITKKPTLTETGTAKRTCTANDGEDTVTLPVLTDTKVWTKDAEKSVAATHAADGKDVYTSTYGTVEVTLPKNADAHEWGNWTITKKPTLTETGTAKRTCTAEDGGEETVPVAKLSDTLTWTKDAEKSVAATHTAEGKDVYTSKYGTVEVTLPKDADAHDWGEWEITKKPDATKTGEAKRTCTAEDGGEETVTLPVVTDTSVWTKDTEESVAATHTTDGKDVYTSDYGTVVITLPKSAEHQWGEWTMTTEPTLTTAGSAEHTCTLAGCTEKETVTVPVLTDTTVWKKETVAPDYINAGKDVYESVYGKIELEGAPKLAAPYEGKTYIPVEVSLNGSGQIGVTTSWTAAKLTIDKNGTGSGTAFPYQNETWTLSMVNGETGEISISTQPTAGGETKTYSAFINTQTGTIVRPRDASWSDVFVLLPYEWAGDSSVTAAKLFESFAITFADAENQENIFVTDDGKISFGVTFALDKAGENKLTAEECKTASPVYVIKDEEVIAAFAQTAEGDFVVADGLEGMYTLTIVGESDSTGETGQVALSGSGFIAIFGENPSDPPIIGTYEIAEEGAGYTVSAEVDGNYFELVLGDDFTGTIEMPTVTITYSVGEGHTAIEAQTAYKNSVANLAKPADTDTHAFFGWYLDADCAQAVPADYKPSADVTLYAKWAEKGTITVFIESDDTTGTAIHFGEGQTLAQVLQNAGIELGIDQTNNRVFKGWQAKKGETLTDILPDKALTKADADGLKIYAKWAELPVYYGTFTGHAMSSSEQYQYAATVEIDEDGKVTFERVKNSGGEKDELTGTVVGYNATTQLLTWKADGAETIYNMRVDAASGFIAFASDMTETELGQNAYVLSRNEGETTTGFNEIAFYNGKSGYNWTYFVTYQTAGGEEKTLLIYTDVIYADVTLSDAAGNALTVENCSDSKTIVVKQSAATVLAFGTTGTSFSKTSKDELGNSATMQLLDTYYGKHTVDGTEFTFNGLGQIDWASKGGEATAGYTFVKEEGGFRLFDVFERKVVTETKDNPNYDPDNEWSEPTITVTSYVNVGYYQLKIPTGEEEGSFEKIMVTVTVKNATGPSTNDGMAQVNAKVTTAPEAPVDPTGNSIFVGWFTDEELTDAFTDGIFEVGGTYTLYAKWDTRVTVTVHYNYDGAPADAVFEFQSGATAEIEGLEREGYYLEGLYTDAECTTAWEGNGQAITASVEVYAKWELVAEMAGTFKGWEKWTNTQSDSDGEEISTLSEMFDCQPDGTYTSKKVTADGTISDADKVVTDGAIQVGRYGYFNKTAGVIWYAYGSSATTVGTDAYIGFDTSRIKTVHYSVNKDIKVNGTAKLTVWLTLTYFDDTTMNVFCFNDKIYDNVTWTAGLKAQGMNDAKEIEVTSKTGEQLLLVVKSGSSFVAPNAERGTYTNTDGETLFLNGGNAVTYTISADEVKTGTYTAVSGKDYNYNVTFGSERWWLTTDTADMSFSIKKPMVTFTFDLNGKGETITASANVKDTWVGFDTLVEETPTAEGFKFGGWYEDAACSGSKVTGFRPSDETPKTYYAKWNKAITVTLVYGKTLENVSVTDKYVEDSYTLPALPTEVIDGQGAEGWYTDPEFENKVTSHTFTDDTTFYCKWVDAHPLMGLYVGYEFDSTRMLSSTKNFTVDLLGNVTGSKSGILGEGTNGVYSLGGQYVYYDADSKTIVTNYKTGATTELTNDVFVMTLVAQASDVSYVSGNGSYLYWNNQMTKLGKFKVGGVEKFFLVKDNKVYGNVSVLINDEAATDLSLAKAAVGNTLTVKNAAGETLVALGWNGTDFVAQDGTQGDYTGTLNGNSVTIVANGYGGFSIDGTALVVTKDNNKLTFVLNNSMKVVTIDTENKTYTQELDGYQGTYTLPDSTDTITLDGYGCAGEGVTYAVEGATLNVFSSEGKNQYGIDVNAKTLSSKSKFAGLTFTGKYYSDWDECDNDIKVIFDDSPSISGVIYSGYGTSYYFNFTAELSGTTLTFTFTSAIDKGAATKTLTATVSGSTLTFVKGTYSSNVYTFWNQGSATCSGFSL